MENVTPIRKEEKSKEFCLLCGKNTDSPLKSVSTIQVEDQMLSIKMCGKCEVVVHNFLRIANLAIQERAITVKDAKRIILPDEIGRGL